MTDQSIPTPELSDSDYELLSAYIDNMLDEPDRLALEERLANDAMLQRELALLQQTVQLVQGLPEMIAPRNFTLSLADVQPLEVDEITQLITDIDDAETKRISQLVAAIDDAEASAAAAETKRITQIVAAIDDAEVPETETPANVTPMPTRPRWQPLLAAVASFATMLICFAAALPALQNNLGGTGAELQVVGDTASEPEAFDDAGAEIALVSTSTPVPTSTVVAAETDLLFSFTSEAVVMPTQVVNDTDLPDLGSAVIAEAEAEITDNPFALTATAIITTTTAEASQAESMQTAELGLFNAESVEATAPTLRTVPQAAAEMTTIPPEPAAVDEAVTAPSINQAEGESEVADEAAAVSMAPEMTEEAFPLSDASAESDVANEAAAVSMAPEMTEEAFPLSDTSVELEDAEADFGDVGGAEADFEEAAEIEPLDVPADGLDLNSDLDLSDSDFRLETTEITSEAVSLAEPMTVLEFLQVFIDGLEYTLGILLDILQLALESTQP